MLFTLQPRCLLSRLSREFSQLERNYGFRGRYRRDARSLAYHREESGEVTGSGPRTESADPGTVRKRLDQDEGRAQKKDMSDQRKTAKKFARNASGASKTTPRFCSPRRWLFILPRHFDQLPLDGRMRTLGLRTSHHQPQLKLDKYCRIGLRLAVFSFLVPMLGDSV